MRRAGGGPDDAAAEGALLLESGPGDPATTLLAAHTAHEILNMVVIILACADNLARRVDPGPTGQVDLGDIRSAAHRVATLARELSRFARRPPSPAAVVDLHDVLRGVESWIRRLVGDGVFLAVEPAATLSTVRGNRRDLEHMLIHLALNAREAMPDGGTLTIATRDGAAPHGPEERLVELVVRDSGIGMSEAVRGRIFEPLFTTKSGSGGTGLGLEAVGSVVRGMAGTIAVESTEGSGTTFRIVLPVAV
jgi:two-component system, cell cycle sensor histidine kinase and response regulator CckA